jgi:hypothetical protein
MGLGDLEAKDVDPTKNWFRWRVHMVPERDEVCRCDRCHPSKHRPHLTSWISDYKWEFVLEETACDECLRRYLHGYEEFRRTAVENCWHCGDCLEIFEAWLNRWYHWEMMQHR